MAEERSELTSVERFDHHLMAGAGYLRDKQVENAQKEFSAALAIRPDDPRALGLLGLAHFQQASFYDALPIYEKLVEINPNDASHWLNLGLVHLKLDKSRLAIIELAKSRELDPGQIRTVSYLGLAYARNGQYAKAYEAFLHADENNLAEEMTQHISAQERAEVDERFNSRNVKRDTKPPPMATVPPAKPVAAKELEPEPEPVAPETDAAEQVVEVEVEEPDAVVSEVDIVESGPVESPPSRKRRDSDKVHKSIRLKTSDEGAVSSGQVESAAVLAEPDAHTAETAPVAAPAATESADDSSGQQALASGAFLARAIEVKKAEDTPDEDNDGGGAVAAPHDDRGLVTMALDAASPSSAAESASAAAPIGHAPPSSLGEFATARLLRPEEGKNRLEIGPEGVLIVRVEHKVYSRAQDVFVTGGELAFEPATRKVRGAATDEVFGEDDNKKLFVVSGRGYLLASAAGGHFAAVTLDDDILYLREELVYAFDDGLHWENGNVPGSKGSLRVVQFRGQGSVALRSSSELMGIKLVEAGLVYVDAGQLAGWVGRVVPRVVDPVAGGASSTQFVECAGEGVVLVLPGPA